MLQECFLTKKELLEIKIRGYRAVVATEFLKPTRKKQRRGSVILVDLFLNVQPLKERSEDGIEMIGVKVVGDTEKTYKNPFELWTVYSGPCKGEAHKCSKMLSKLYKERKNRVLLAGDLNTNLSTNPNQGTDRCLEIRKKLEELEEECQVSILNEYGARTTPRGTAIDIAVTMGDWEEGFAHPIEWDLGSTHFPICIGVITKEKNSSKMDYVNLPRYRRTKETEGRIRRQCATLSKEIQDYTEDTLAQAILNAFRNEAMDPTPKKKKRIQRNWWSTEIESLFLRKQEHLKKNGKDEEFKRLDQELNNEIIKAKNVSFQEYASGLDHRNHNSDIYRAIRTVGSRQPSKIAQLTVLGKDGSIVTNMKEKADILSKRYQVPLGYHPKRDPLRKKMIKQTRREQEAKYPRGIGHAPFTASEARIAREEMANDKAPGLSRIRKEDLEMGGDKMDTLVAQLADKITHSGQWPQTLKKGVTCPIPKDEEATDIIEEDQTRPITMIETLDKSRKKVI